MLPPTSRPIVVLPRSPLVTAVGCDAKMVLHVSAFSAATGYHDDRKTTYGYESTPCRSRGIGEGWRWELTLGHYGASNAHGSRLQFVEQPKGLFPKRRFSVLKSSGSAMPRRTVSVIGLSFVVSLGVAHAGPRDQA